MKKLILFIFFCLVSLSAFTQTNTPKFTVSEQYSFKDSVDYDTYEPQIIEAIDWYLWRSMAFDANKRKETSSFFIQWLIGSPKVSVEINPDIVNFSTTNPPLMIPFMMGWTKHSLESKSKDKLQGNMEGIKTTVEYYNKNKGFLKKDKNIEDYEKMINKNKLEDYIKKQLAKTSK